MIVTTTSFSTFYRVIGCINSILNSSINDTSLIIQSGFDDVLEYPVIRREYESQYDLFPPLNYDFYVTYLGETSFKTFLNRLKKHEYFKPNAKYIFMGEKPDVPSILTLLNDFVLNFVIVVVETSEILTVFPYPTGILKEVSTDLNKIGSCQDGSSILERSGSMFPNKIPTVWKRTNLTLVYNYEAPYSMATTGNKKGIEIDWLQLVCERLNMEAEYVDRKDPVSYAMFILAKTGRYDIWFGNIAVSINPTKDLTTPYSCDSAFWYVPQAKTIPKWKLPLIVFSLNVNLTWFLSALFLCLLWDATYILLDTKKHGRFLLDKMWRTFKILLDQSVKLKQEYATLGILLFLLLQSFLVLNSLYKAKYTFYLSGVNHEKSLETLDEVMKRGLKLGSTTFMIGVYNTTPKVKEYLKDNFVVCDTGPTCMTRSAEERDLAVLKPYRKVAYIRDTFVDQHGHYNHHRLQSPVFTICNSFLFPKGHPMYPLFDHYVYLTVQHGFVQHFIATYDQILKRKQTSTRFRNPRLKFDAVRGPVFLIAIGGFIGFAVFVIEIILCRKKGMN